MSRRALWLEVYNRFEPEEPVPVDRPEWRAERIHGPVVKILQDLTPPFEARILLLGTVGTGKTTELRRVEAARQGEDFVVFLDLARHFDQVVGNPEALQRIALWEICFLVGLALYRLAAERLEFDWPREPIQALADAWRDMARATGVEPPAQLDLSKLAKTMFQASAELLPGGKALQALGTAMEAVKWNLPLGQTQKTLPDDDIRMSKLLDSVNWLLGEFRQNTLHGRVLLVIDGLDRIRDVDRARSLFIDSEMLARLKCPIVVSGPFVLRHHLAVSTVRRFQVSQLVNEPVLMQSSPAQPGPGIPFFFDVFHRRVRDLQGDDLLSGDLLRRLSYYSGGRARDFMRLVRQLAQRCYHADVAQATPALVDEVIDEARRLLETGMHRGHIEILESVMRDPDHRLPQDGLVLELLTSSRLLPYPDGSEWFYPHPLLTLNLLHPVQTG